MLRLCWAAAFGWHVTLAVRTGVTQDGMVKADDGSAAALLSGSDRQLSSARKHAAQRRSNKDRIDGLSNDDLFDGTLPPKLAERYTWQAETVYSDTVIAFDEQEKKKVTLRFFFTRDDEIYVSAKLYKEKAQQVEKARKSCEVVKQIKSKGDQGHVGYQRIQDCLDHNLPENVAAAGKMAPDDILYVVLEHAGDQVLWDLIDSGEDIQEPKIAAGIFKQILQGLEFLETLDPVRVHHDLRPSSIWLMKDEEGDGYYTFLTDFSNSVEVTDEGQCTLTESDDAFSPPEYKETTDACEEGVNYMPSCLGAYDIYSAAVIYLAMLWTETAYEDDPIRKLAGLGKTVEGRPAFAFGRFSYMASSKELAKYMKVDVAANDPMSGIFYDVTRALHKVCWNRPTVDDLLTKNVKAWSKIKPKGVGGWHVA